MAQHDAVIVAAVRSPIGRANKGSLIDLRPDELATQLVQAAFDQVPSLDPSSVEDLLLGCAQPAGESGFNLARIVAVELGLDKVPGTTVNRYCSSSLQTTRMAMHAIRAGEGDVFISAGVETVSRYGRGLSDGPAGAHNPRFFGAESRTTRAEIGWFDPRLAGELPDVYISMGQTAENVAGLCKVSRSDQDAFAAISQNRAEQAGKDGFWSAEITPVTCPDGSVVCADDGPRAGVTLETLGRLRPAFRVDGTVTAGNACPLNDGAAALIVMSSDRARDLGIVPLARIVSTSVTALSPEIMGLGPVGAVKKALALAGMTVTDVDLFEINEAFAAQVVASMRALSLDHERVNVRGGAIALGHPFGSTGARITTTLLHGLQETDSSVGVETMCVGGGQGMAMVVERLS